MKFEIGDWVVCIASNIDLPKVIGRRGTVHQVNGSSKHPYKVDFKDGLFIWCEVAPCTKLHKLLLGVGDDTF